ncbi:probable gmp synthase [glutamine-hydrolyzing] [Phtheirospermum japonicum]|uniref:Probable gmp synthase [glutamine-hydrolyzing] n=1 Tax=Phtheirospermum japonicum TaxID=374723 RepID=A0A830CG13_9LAMI|nr:probable gmp synthase [glutamine-hydrolyzing] [Phtheirospermum japonicum]
MPKLQCLKKHALEKSKNDISREKEKQNNNYSNLFSKNLKKIYPINGLPRTCSPLSLSLSLSQNSSTDSSLTDNSTSLDQKISFALRLIAPVRKREAPVSKIVENYSGLDINPSDEGTRRCNWVTKNSDKIYVQFHDECWGVPVYDDNKMFELLAMCGMLMDFNWTEIIKRREFLREAFAGFDPNNVSKMGEKEINYISSNKELTLAESRVAKEYGSFSSYMWDYVSYKAVINKFRHPRNVPLRSSKAEVISKDMVRRGFRFVGPVIVYSFMQAAGMTIDHLVDCFRYGECVNLAERPWRHV